MNKSLQQLYQSIILKHNKEPIQYAKNENASHIIEAYNPLCGDQFTLYFDLENGRFANLSFHGYGCAISKASTSVLVSRMEGLEIGEGKALCEGFQSIILPEENAAAALDDPELMAFSSVKQFPGRLKCASLSWDELLDFLEKNAN